MTACALTIEGYRTKCKNLRVKQKVYQFYTINGLIHLRIWSSKNYDSMVDLQNLFPDIGIDSF